MICSRNKKIAAMTTALVGTVALAIHFPPTSRTNASDHIDSPTIAQDRAAILPPRGRSRSERQLKRRPAMSTKISSYQSISVWSFDHNIRYRFEIENTGDATGIIRRHLLRGLGRQTPDRHHYLPDGRSFTARPLRRKNHSASRGDERSGN